VSMTYREAITLAAELHHPPHQHADVVRDRLAPAAAVNAYGVKLWYENTDDVYMIASLAQYAREVLLMLEGTEEALRAEGEDANEA